MSLRRTDKALPKPEPAPKKARKPLKRGKAIKQRSAKRAAVDGQRGAFVRAQLERRQTCEACVWIAEVVGALFTRAGRWMGCEGRSRDLHEPATRGRNPGSDTILAAANSVATCRKGHDWIHQHPAMAERAGLLVPSSGWVDGEAFQRIHGRIERLKRAGIVQALTVTHEDGIMALKADGFSVRCDVAGGAHQRAAETMDALTVPTPEWDATGERAAAFRAQQDHTLEDCKTGGCAVCSEPLPFVPT